MGKYLWRKQSSYIRVEEDQPRCIWTVFQLFNYHPWHNVRKMLPYKKHKSHDNKSSKSGIQPEEEYEISHPLELEEDLIIKRSASVNSDSSRNGGSASKRSIKARIKSLIGEKNNSTESDHHLLVQKPDEFQGLKDKYDGEDACAQTLMSLLKANPKLIKSIKHVNESSNVKPETKVTHKDSKMEDDYVGVLDLFKVDQDLFIRNLQDSPPNKLKKFVKCGTFPSLNPSNFERRPTKVEHKYYEVWPVNGNARELRKAKSQGFARSSSITEYSLDKYGYLSDSSSNKSIKKHLSKSLRVNNEKEFASLYDLQGRRSFKERLNVSMNDSKEPSRASLERWYNTNYGETRGLRLDSPRDVESFAESESQGKEHSFIFDQRPRVLEQFDPVTTASNNRTNLEVCLPADEIENLDWSMSEESPPIVSNSPPTLSTNMEEVHVENDQFSMDCYNEYLQYVKYVVDIAGLFTTENQREEWHSQTQPLDPALFDGIEVCCPFEPILSDKDAICTSNNSHRKVVFDLINEALVDINTRSSVYYPKSLSFWCHVCPTTKEKRHGLGEVWEFVREYLSWRPELDPSLNIAVDHDLSKDKNGWVNLQTDTECLGLELEDLIFNELLDEIVCFYT